MSSKGGLLMMVMLALSPCTSAIAQRYAYATWSPAIKSGVCEPSGVVPCDVDQGRRVYRFPAGIFEIEEQLLVPPDTSLIGARDPNDMSNPMASPEWSAQTLFLATRGATEFGTTYCHAADMVTTRVGFVLSSHVHVANVSYQGIDTIRPDDNGALCGGGAFETKGCAENDCNVSSVNNGGSDGAGSEHVTIENVRLNAFYYPEDKGKVGAPIDGQTECLTTNFSAGCCLFCRPNGVRTSQVAVWVPASRDEAGTRHLHVRNLVSLSQQADGINLHGRVRHTLVERAFVANSGDDAFALWGAHADPENVTFSALVAVDPGILRPAWYGSCVATYGAREVRFHDVTCRDRTFAAPLPFPSEWGGHRDTRAANSAFCFYASFDASYPSGNRITIDGVAYEDLSGQARTPGDGVVDLNPRLSGKKAWTTSSHGRPTAYYLDGIATDLNVDVVDRGEGAAKLLGGDRAAS